NSPKVRSKATDEPPDYFVTEFGILIHLKELFNGHAGRRKEKDSASHSDYIAIENIDSCSPSCLMQEYSGTKLIKFNFVTNNGCAIDKIFDIRFRNPLWEDIDLDVIYDLVNFSESLQSLIFAHR